MSSFSLSGGVEVLGFISPTDSLDTYAVIDPLYGVDGFRNVNSLSDLDLIPEPRRRAGMVVGVSGGTSYYKLNISPWNYNFSDWSIFNSGGGGSTVFTGGTVSGDTIFTQGLSANTFSATTYLGLPLDVYVTGGTYSNGTTTFTNNTGGTFNVTGFITGFTDIQVTGYTYQDNTFTIFDSSGNTFSATIDVVTGLTVNGTISATTYQNLPQDIFVTGGTYTNGEILFRNNAGSYFTVTGLPIGGAGGQVYYLNLSQTQTPYQEFSPIGTNLTGVTTGVTINSGVTSTIASFLTPVGYPNTTTIPAGYWSFYIHSYKDVVNASFDVFCEVYTYTTGGTETLILTTEGADVTTYSPTVSMELTDGYYSGGTIDITDRILVKVRTTNNGSQTNTLTFFTEGQQHYSYGITPFSNFNALTCETLSGCTTIVNLENNKVDKSGDTMTGTLYVPTISANTISATTIGSSGDCVSDLYVSNIRSCSPLNINPLDEGNVYFGSSGVTFDLINNKVGIGTSTPSTIFHVVGNYTGSTDALIPQMLFQNSNTIPNTNKTAIVRTSVGTGYYVGGYPEIWLESQETSAGVGLTKLRTVSNHPLLFYTNDIERGRFGNTGNFGLNTQSPAGMLHVRTGVNKNIIFTSGTTRNLIRSLIDGNSNYVGLEIDTLDLNIKTNGVDRVIINSSGDTGIGTITPTAKVHINNTTSGNTFLAEDDTNPDSSPFVIDASGNTGIGTLTPYAKLDISSNGGRLRLSQNLVGNVFNGIDFVSYVGGVNGSLISNQFTGELRLYTSPTYFPTFYSSGNEVMRISTSGNVGIGTTTPSEKLDVSGKTKTINLQVTSGATTGYVLTSDSSGNATWQTPTTFTGGTVSGLTATTISATTYQNLPTSSTITGGTFNFTGNTLTLNSNDGNTIPITGFTYERQSDYVYPYFYGGSASLYTPTSTATWIIKRVNYTTPGSPITQSAIGSWDNRYTLTYT